MGFFKSLFIRFQTNCETMEDHRDTDLKTKYFKTNYNQMYNTVENVFLNNKRYKILNQSKDHGEFAVTIEGNEKLFVIVSIITLRPLETAVDIKISTDNFSLLGNYPKLKKEILALYKVLNEKHTYIGNGLSEVK